MTFEQPGSIFQVPARFVLRRMLGRGGMGVVYEAIDSDHQTTVALKTLLHLSSDSLLLLKREFRALQDLIHPNLVRFSELHEHAGCWFFTMELVEGSDFLTYVSAADSPLGTSTGSGTEQSNETTTSVDDTIPGGHWSSNREAAEDTVVDPGHASNGSSKSSSSSGPLKFNEARLRSALVQLAEGLSALHRAKKVHRDIKPSADAGCRSLRKKGDTGRLRTWCGMLPARFTAGSCAAVLGQSLNSSD